MHPSDVTRFLMAAIVGCTAISSVLATPITSNSAPHISNTPSPIAAGGERSIVLADGRVFPADSDQLPPFIEGELLTIADTDEETNSGTSGTPAAVEKRSFMGTYEACRTSGAILSCRCRDGWGSLVFTELNLNLCLANNQGTVEWRRNGNFGASCDTAKSLWRETSSYLVGCYDGNGDLHPNGVYLNTRIHNWNGVLGCDVPN